MIHQRKFAIKITDSDVYHWTNQEEIFIGKIYKHSAKYSYDITRIEDNIKVWKYKKSCEKSIKNLQNNLTPTKAKNKIFEVVEITDNQTLRYIKLKKIK